jgi:DnaJ family protein C protein 3
MKKYMDALKDVTNALQVDPSSTEYKIAKAKLLVNVGQCDRALEEYKELQYTGKELEEAQTCARAMELGHQAFYDERWEEASNYFMQAMQFVELASDLTFSRAQALYQMGDYYGVISDTGRVLKAHPNHVEAYQLRGQAYTRLGDHDTAQVHFREGLKQDPEHKGCKEGHKFIKTLTKKDKRGNDAFAAGKYKDAIGYWWQAIEVDNTHAAFCRPVLLKIIKAHTKAGEHDMAILEAQKHLDGGETVEGLWAMGDAQIAAEKFEEAVRSFQRAQEIAVSVATVHVYCVSCKVMYTGYVFVLHYVSFYRIMRRKSKHSKRREKQKSLSSRARKRITTRFLVWQETQMQRKSKRHIATWLFDGTFRYARRDSEMGNAFVIVFLTTTFYCHSL